MSLRTIIAWAYDIPLTERFALIGGPSDVLSARFDIQAKAPDGAPNGRHFLMLRTLLAERFKLRLHREARQVPLYALTVARRGTLGPELRPSTVDCAAAREKALAAGERLTEANAPRDGKGRPLCWATLRTPGVQTRTTAGRLTELLATVQGVMMDRPVIDATGLTGTYEWHLVYALKPGATTSEPGAVPLLPTALEEQLGLKVEEQTGPFDVLVIDSVEMPTPN